MSDRISIVELRERRRNGFGKAFPLVSYDTLQALVEAVEAAYLFRGEDAEPCSDYAGQLDDALAHFDFRDDT